MKKDERKKVIYVLTVCIIGSMIICLIPFLLNLLT